ncbi:hypothetical protein MMC18_000223 [Xylographa bjoerkii]|nr:hypothetical protein [Xylographa bjoerkii]
MESISSYVATATKIPHPFYPLEAEIVGYLANEQSVPVLLGLFALGCVGIYGITQGLVRRYNPGLSGWERAAICWFIISGSIHLFFEGYFSLNHTRMAGMTDFFGQLWKEYAFSDSRYLTSDPFVLCMETVTAALWGPLSFIVAFMILRNHPLRHPLQALVSTGQIYGDILYYATSMFDLYYKGTIYCRPEPYYFWCYYFFMNFIWIVIPGVLLYNSIDASAKALKAVDTMSNTLKANGHTKKVN